MKSEILALKPQSVWKNFYNINQIPRCSGNETAVGEYITNFAEKLGLKWKRDNTGNIVIAKPASPGMENRPAIVIQGHLDMVCEKNKNTIHDFTKDPIRMLIKDGWVTADGTTLGADNGIAVAMGMAVMEDNTINHPPIEFLFTVDEETGLTGALELKSDFVNGRILLNIDSEEEGALYIGCAGGQHTILKKTIQWINPHDDYKSFLLRISGLRGGHSGLNIHEGYGNAIKLLARFLYSLTGEFHFHITNINGGSKHNAIPREAEVIIDIPAKESEALSGLAANFNDVLKNEFKEVEKNVMLSVENHERPDKVFNTQFRDQLIKLLHAMPHGVYAMSKAIEGLVETSTNMAVIETKADKVELLTSQRSSIASSIIDIASKVKAVGELAGFEVEEGGGYPAWAPNPDSGLLKTCQEIFVKKYKKQARVKAIHAGLECGIIGEHYPGMDMISFGPDIEGAHSPDERIRIKSVEHVWEFLQEILREIK